MKRVVFKFMKVKWDVGGWCKVKQGYGICTNFINHMTDIALSWVYSDCLNKILIIWRGRYTESLVYSLNYEFECTRKYTKIFTVINLKKN